jgi:hypothetical protein
MPFCNICADSFPVQRKELGYNVCLACGGRKAEAEKIRKSKCTAPAYNKGAYQYITSRDMAKDAGKKGK